MIPACDGKSNRRICRVRNRHKAHRCLWHHKYNDDDGNNNNNNNKTSTTTNNNNYNHDK